MDTDAIDTMAAGGAEATVDIPVAAMEVILVAATEAATAALGANPPASPPAAVSVADGNYY